MVRGRWDWVWCEVLGIVGRVDVMAPRECGWRGLMVWCVWLEVEGEGG